MDGSIFSPLVGFIALICAGVGVWVSMRERIVRAETKIETLESSQREHKSEVQLLREWLEGQFSELRKDIARKADR